MSLSFHVGIVRVFLCALLASCGGHADDESEGRSAAAPSSLSPAARALRIPVMRLAPVVDTRAGLVGKPVRIRVVIEGRIPSDTSYRTGVIDPVCGDSIRDLRVESSGTALIGALVWVEGTTPVIAAPVQQERRPVVTLGDCLLLPQVQTAAPGSTLQLVMRDARIDTLIVVPTRSAAALDTVSFLTDGQLVPLRGRAESVGVIGVYSTRLPWAKAFVAITPAGASGVTDRDGTARVVLDAAGRKATLRAWHPLLGVVATTIDPSKIPVDALVTLTFRR